MTNRDHKSLWLPVAAYLIFALVVGVVATWWFDGHRVDSVALPNFSPSMSAPDEAAITIKNFDTGSVRVVAEESANVSDQPPPPALPPADVPLVQQLETLVERAESGDPVASCRLIMSINRCTEEIRNRKFTEQMIKSLQQKQRASDEFLIGMAARFEQRAEEAGDYCKNVDPAMLPDIETIASRSLPNLNAHQKTVLAMIRSDGNLRRLANNASFGASGYYILPQFLADHTHEFLLAGYAARDPLALEGLVMIHAPAGTLSPQGVGLWLPNPRLFLQYAWLMQKLYGSDSLGRHAVEASRRVARSMTPPELEKVRRAVEQEEFRWRQAASERSLRQDAIADRNALSECSGD